MFCSIKRCKSFAHKSGLEFTLLKLRISCNNSFFYSRKKHILRHLLSYRSLLNATSMQQNKHSKCIKSSVASEHQLTRKVIILCDYIHSTLYISKQSANTISQVVICHSLHQNGPDCQRQNA